MPVRSPAPAMAVGGGMLDNTFCLTVQYIDGSRHCSRDSPHRSAVSEVPAARHVTCLGRAEKFFALWAKLVRVNARFDVATDESPAIRVEC